MKANKDKGTSVGFSKVVLQPTENRLDDIEVEFKNVPVFDDSTFKTNPEPQYPSKENGYNRGLGKGSFEFMNKECEHEWDEITETEYLTITLKVCKKCHANKFPTAFKRSATDFKIPENIEQINKQEWEDIENEFYKFTRRILNPPFDEYKKWLKENYLPPVKKA